ncbi:MAG: hypothetical protein AAFV69_11490 [Pseudomonadota bacterium]
MAPPDLLPGFGPSSPDRSTATRALKDLVRKAFDVDADAPVFVAEVSCGEVDCPDAETVIAIYLDENRTEFRFAKPIADVTGADIARIANDRTKASG